MSEKNSAISLKDCLLSDLSNINNLQKAIKKRTQQQLPATKLEEKLSKLMHDSSKLVSQRDAIIPKNIEYDDGLPVSQSREKVAQLIKDNQVVVIAGETGSGKTTQLPKICLELGLGRRGRIGHTQPRRVAATSVSRRIAGELKSEIGQVIGYNIRFNDQTNAVTPVKVMTDGVLLNEIIHDPLLLQYDAIIIDEAHERSLNIDFLLGYLRQLIAKRSDIKIIITSATIDVERFSEHFKTNGKPAPVLEISGRTYPVDVWYRPNDEENPLPQTDHIGHAVEEIMAHGPGDILIFLPGEADIRDTAKHLRKEAFKNCEVLPLYARLSMSEQERIFKPSGGKRRIVLATNVAETSLTVPGIRYVIDPGLARISRYSVRSKIQRLPIEKISQASANQRKGRCGRVAEGVCIRLYSEEDFNERKEFTDAEILRTNLAAVILQMKQLKLGDIEAFPFIDPPADRQVSDGLNLLNELQAISKDKELTHIGRQMARLPIEPRLARILLESEERNYLSYALVLAAFLSVKDPREWPFDKKELAQQKHAKYKHKTSDFIAIINLWNHLHEQQAELSNSQFRRYCGEELINFNAYREWKSTYRQLKSLMQQSKSHKKLTPKEWQTAEFEQEDPVFYQNLHQVLLSGLLSFIGQKDLEKGYQGTRQSKFMVHPQSTNFKKQPAWLVTFEVVETTQAYARMTAAIEPLWLEQIAKHLIKTHYYDAHWSKNRGAVVAEMQQTLLGLKIVTNRTVNYSAVEPELCRELFILHALVRQDLESKQPFHKHNVQVKKDVEQEIAKARQADLWADETTIAQWFERKLPDHINSVKSLNNWLKKDPKKHNALISLSADVLLPQEQEEDKGLYPEFIKAKGVELPLKYHFEPGHEKDGVTVRLPQSLVGQFSDGDFERLVPGLLEEKIEFLIRSLPKRFRKNFVPVPTFAKACYEKVLESKGRLVDIITKHLFTMTGVILPQEAWSELNLPEHFLMRFEVVNDAGKLLYSSRSLEAKPRKVEKAKSKPSKKVKNVTYTSWPEEFVQKGTMQEAGTDIPIFNAIEDAKDKVRIIPVVNQRQAEKTHIRGVCRLMALSESKTFSYLQKKYHNRQQLMLACASLYSPEDLINDVMMSVIKDHVSRKVPYDKAGYDSVLKEVQENIVPDSNKILDQLVGTLKQRNSCLADAKALGKNFSAAYDDIKQQLEFLFQPGFCYRFGAEHVRDYARYLKAIQLRLERIKHNPLKDLQIMQQYQPWLEQVEQLEQNQKIPQFEVDEYCWMLQEYRISLFAQGQKTRFPISSKRLQKFIDNLNREYI
ncbi:ATP-dependent RNA helicase HrpA [Kangiella spongicola]|uniref:ATP-dependent RNA helicase HrpA n=1 Tax=Kangiella spongicola TaxID=796379 RepID=A0A318D980_9GAMM|nr:ATP-dependent RNA helicase HrpA [Kangiella spongicola]PXF62709.1 ATP-dependent RNA helicase HrpA [Kangiella spongicola]